MLPEPEFCEVVIVNTHIKNRIRMACIFYLLVVLRTIENVSE